MRRYFLAVVVLLGLLFIFSGCSPTPICSVSELMKPTLVSPGFWEVVNSLTPTLDWTYPVGLYDYSYPFPYYYLGAPDCVPEKFRVWLMTGPFFEDDIGGMTDNGSVTNWMPPTPLEPATEYAWGVQAMVGETAGLYAGRSYFFTGPYCPTEELVAPTLLQPANNSVIADLWPSLIWDYPEACLPNGYRIDLSTTEDFSDISLSGGTGNPSTRWGAGHELDDCTRYYWKVAPINDITLGPESETFTFFIDATGSCPFYPHLPDFPLFHIELESPCKIGPGPEYADLRMLTAGFAASTAGRNDDGSWLLLQLSESVRCWTPANVGTLDGDLLGLPVVETPLIVSTETPTPVPDCVFTFLEKTNCRSGPGVIYDYLTSGNPGQPASVNGRNRDASWYQVQLNGTICWVRSTLGTYNCDPGDLRIIAAPPTPTNSPESNLPSNPTPTFTPVPTATFIPTKTPVPTATVINCSLFDRRQCEYTYGNTCYWDLKANPPVCRNR